MSTIKTDPACVDFSRNNNAISRTKLAHFVLGETTVPRELKQNVTRAAIAAVQKKHIIYQGYTSTW